MEEDHMRHAGSRAFGLGGWQVGQADDDGFSRLVLPVPRPPLPAPVQPEAKGREHRQSCRRDGGRQNKDVAGWVGSHLHK